jgi:putative membrane protein
MAAKSATPAQSGPRPRQSRATGQPDPGGPTPSTDPPALSLAVRGGFGGVLMGLANLVPGISGGTMLLAVGIYPRFITAVGEVTTLRFRRPSLLTLGSVVLAALAAVAFLAGPVKELVVAHRWLMYSLFIGLTLGGVPVLWRLIGRHSASMWVGAAFGLAGMVALGLSQQLGWMPGTSQQGFGWMLAAGAAAASAGILPGVSGGYLLLVLGVYVPLLAAVDRFKDAAGAVNVGELWAIGWSVLLPVGLGIVLGVGLISNLLRWLLDRFEKPTLGVLLGLLLGAVVGLYPFQQTVKPEPGDTIKGQTVVQTEAGLQLKETGRAVRPADYPTRFFAPRWYHLGSVGGLIVAGFAVTWVIDRIGRNGQGDEQAAKARSARVR